MSNRSSRQHGNRSPLARRLLHGTAATAVVAVALAGCTGPGAGSGAGGGAAEASRPAGPAAADALAESAPDAFAARGRQGAADGTSSQATLLSRDVIRRADLAVRSRDVGGALVRARTIVEGAQGIVADEHTVTGRGGEPRHSTLTLRVPADAFSTVLRELGDLGRLASQSVSTEDVSTELVDVEARILSAERTIDRVRDLLDAADDFSDILSLEGELARREADLASLKAQQAYLEDQTALSTIQLSLLPRLERGAEPDEEPAGFVAGLRTGWDALAGLVTVLLTVLGVLVPLLVLLVPTAALVWWAARRLTRRRPVQPAQPPAT